MTEYEKYLFDLNGYLVIEDLLSKELVASLNRAIDHHMPDAPQQRRASTRARSS